VLDCSTERIYDVLKQAQQIGMMSDYHSYLITSLDLHSVDLEEFKYGGTNITALRLVDPEDAELQKVVQNWVYGELRYGRKLDLPPPRVRDLDHSTLSARLAGMHAAECLFVMPLSVSG
jgi:ionotropic kainate glutamate receptor 2